MGSVKDFIQARKDLFWSVGQANADRISEPLLVETILNYGSLEDVKALFQMLGLKETAAIFFKATQNRSRHNYFPQVENFFRLYFQRHVR